MKKTLESNAEIKTSNNSQFLHLSIIILICLMSFTLPFFRISGNVIYGIIDTDIEAGVYFHKFSYTIKAQNFGIELGDDLSFLDMGGFGEDAAAVVGSGSKVNITVIPYTADGQAKINVITEPGKTPWWTEGRTETVKISVSNWERDINISSVIINRIRLEIQKEGKQPQVIYTKEINQAINIGETLEKIVRVKCPAGSGGFAIVGMIEASIADINGGTTSGVSTDYSTGANNAIKILPITAWTSFKIMLFPVAIILFWLVFFISLFSFIISILRYFSIIGPKTPLAYNIEIFSEKQKAIIPSLFYFLSFLIILISGHLFAFTMGELLEMSEMVYYGGAFIIIMAGAAVSGLYAIYAYNNMSE